MVPGNRGELFTRVSAGSVRGAVPAAVSGRVNRPRRLAAASIFLFVIAAGFPTRARAAEEIPEQVRLILESRCFDCHGPDTQESGLRLDSRMSALRGGDSGERVIVPESSESSYLIELVTSSEESHRMPPDGDALTEEQIQRLREWIDRGPGWTTAAAALAAEKPDHWSLQQLQRPAVPRADTTLPIDAFVQSRLSETGIAASPSASRRTLIRRLYLVMHGLPPSISEVDRFINDDRADAWARLVDRVLSSPRYGERWAAHWLDLVRFGETHGFETNRERPNAWHYRDWVINSFNTDKPYREFVRQQIAGDVLGEPIGTGFLVAGPYDLVKGQNPELQLMQRQDELADMINTTGTAFLGLTLGCARCHNHKFDPISQTDYYAVQAVFAGVQHGDRALPPSRENAKQIESLNRRIRRLEELLAPFARNSNSALQVIDDREALPATVRRIEHLIAPRGEGINPAGSDPGHADDPGTAARMPNISGGTYSWWDNRPGTAVAAFRPRKSGSFRVWVSWGSGHDSHTSDARYVLDADGDHATTHDQTEIANVDQQKQADGSGGAVGKSLWSGLYDAGVHQLTLRTCVLVIGGETGTAITTDVMVLEPAEASEPLTAAPRPSLRPAVTAAHNVERFPRTQARFVRFTIDETNGSQPCIDELEIFSGQQNLALASAGAKATSSGNFVHALHKLEHINDGAYGNARSWIAAQQIGWVQIELLETSWIDRIEWARDRQQKYTDRTAIRYRIEAAVDEAAVEDGAWIPLTSSADRIPFEGKGSGQTAYDFGQSAPAVAQQGRAWLAEWKQVNQELQAISAPTTVYAGTFVQPEPVHRLYRGEHSSPREEVMPGTVAAIGKLPLNSSTPEAERRMAFADWLVHPDNPLTARVIANRIWQFHFGTGLVDTPSDFGKNGTRPTHPRLLDWLATELQQHGWSLKHLHRTILMSETWQQDSRPNAESMKRDANTRLLWRFPPRRLEAEAIRDCIVAASGVLNESAFGPGFSGFAVEMENVRHYFPKTEFSADDWRRMIYMTKVRQERDSVFGVFDCPDASQVVPKRSRSTTPLQALNLLNSRFVNQQAELFADRLARSQNAASAGSVKETVSQAFQICYSRKPDAAEARMASEFIAEHGLLQFARALLNSSEFLFIP